MRLPRIRRTLARIGDAGFIALVVIALAFFLYITPYVVDAVQCVPSTKQPAQQREDGEDGTDLSFWQCLGKTYNQARRDTNLAAIIIALAVTLAAWRPERPRRRPNRRRPTRTRAHNRPNSPRRPQLRRSQDDAP